MNGFRKQIKLENQLRKVEKDNCTNEMGRFHHQQAEMRSPQSLQAGQGAAASLLMSPWALGSRQLPLHQQVGP
jgi:UTP-glucose-1-phosphate uridylyltransferase